MNELKKTVVPSGRFETLDRMSTPLHASRLSGATAAEDARCMAIIRAEIDRLTRERDEHARWRAELADKLHATESLVSELRAERDALAKGVSDVAALIAESRGVAGLHLNGDEAPWDDLRTGGQYEGWLLNFDVANAQIEQERSEQKEG